MKRDRLARRLLVRPLYPRTPTYSRMKRVAGRPYLPLDEHNVKWSQTVNVTVQVAVNRETMDLLPSELKLVVEQVRY